MAEQIIKVKVFRHDSQDDTRQPCTYEVPLTDGMSVMDVLNHIYEQLDGSLAYYDHAACHEAVCGNCTLLVNGRPKLICQTLATGDLRIEPLRGSTVIRDLVYEKRSR